MAEDGDNSKGGGGILVILVPLIVLFLYIALLGPAVRYYDDCPPPIQKGLETVYYPLAWLAEHTPLQEPLEWYVNLWQP